MSLHTRLRQLIGQSFEFRSMQWRLIDVIIDDDQVVLQRLNGPAELIQDNQFGQAHRRVSETLCLPISAADHQDQYSDELLALLQGRQPQSAASKRS